MDVEGSPNEFERIEDWPVIDEALAADPQGDELEARPNAAAGSTGSNACTGEISFDEAMDSCSASSAPPPSCSPKASSGDGQSTGETARPTAWA